MVVDDDASEIGDDVHETLEAVVPVGGDLEDEHHSLMGEAKLKVTDLANMVDEILSVVELLGGIVREGVLADLVKEKDDVGLLQDDFAHGDEGSPGGLGVFDKVLPCVNGVVLEDYGRNLFSNVAVEPAHSVTGDKGDHVVFERDEIVWLHQIGIVSETRVHRTAHRQRGRNRVIYSMKVQ